MSKCDRREWSARFRAPRTWSRLWRGTPALVLAAACGGGPTSSDRTPVAKVAVSPPSMNIEVGGTANLAAVVRDADGNILTGRQIFWSSQDTNVAVVSQDGVVTGRTLGSVQIAASSEGAPGFAVVNVVPVAAGSVSISPPAKNLLPRETVLLSAVVRDGQGNVLEGRPVYWTSSNDAVAVVSSGGLVTALAPGTVQITATSEGKIGSASITVLDLSVASVVVSPSNPSVALGQSVQLTATTLDINGGVLTGHAITWSSSNNSVATVSSSGLVTATGGGVATITATSEGKSGSTTVTVTVAVARVEVSPSSTSIKVGSTKQLTARTFDVNGQEILGRQVSWSSSDPSIATVDANGLVRGREVGTVTITATSEGVEGTSVVQVRRR